MKKKKDKREADIANVKSRKNGDATTLGRCFYYFFFFQFISIRFIRGTKLDIFDISSLCLLLLSIYVTFIRFENDRDATYRSYGNIVELTMLDFTKRAIYIRFAKISSIFQKMQLLRHFTMGKKNYHYQCSINYISMKFFEIIFAKKFIACEGKRSGKFDVVHACRLRSFTHRPL